MQSLLVMLATSRYKLNSSAQLTGCLNLVATSLQNKLKCTINRLSHFSGNLSLHNKLKFTINWLFQFSSNLSLQNKLKCTINRLSHFSGNLSLHNKLKSTTNWLLQFSSNLSLQNKIKCTNTWLSQSSGNLLLQCLSFWSPTLRRPITNQLQRLNYLVVYTGGHSIIGKNDFYHFLVSTICRHLFLNGYK